MVEVKEYPSGSGIMLAVFKQPFNGFGLAPLETYGHCPKLDPYV